MLKAKTLAELEAIFDKALDKFDKVKPKIDVIENGLYRVEGSKGNFYEIRIGQTAEGEAFIACLCRASLESKACYHGAGALREHLEIMRLDKIRDRKAQDNAPYLKQSSDAKPAQLGRFRF